MADFLPKLPLEAYQTDAITESPRIGVEYAKECGQKPWRYTVTDSPWVSVKPKGEPK